MADSAAFEMACEWLERETSFDRLEARGTVRLALKASGLDPRNVSPEQMSVVVGKVLAGELASRGVDDGDRICSALAGELATLESTGSGETPEAVFSRLGG